jgi:hypothetical protein
MDLFLTFATQSLMRWIGLFHSAEAGTGALLAIFILFLPYAVFVFAFRDVPWNRVMKRRIKALNEVVEASLSQEKAVARADEIMRDCAFLGKRWKIYESEIVEDDDSSRRYNVLDPHEWFSVGRLVGHGYERWLSTMAGVALTLGLLFTFVGLSAALIRVGSVGSDTEAMKEAINGLLAISSAKFITSIGGLVVYIALTLAARHFHLRQKRRSMELVDAIQGLTTPANPERLMHEQIVLSRKQLDRLEHFTDDLATALDKRMNATLGARLDDLPTRLRTVVEPAMTTCMNPVVSAISELGNGIVTSNQEGMQEMLSEFLRELRGSAGQEMESVARRMADFADVLEGMRGHLGESGQDFSKQLEGAAQALLSAASKIDEAFDARLSDVKVRFDRFDEVLASNVDRFDALGEKLHGGVREGVSGAVAAIMESARSASETQRSAMSESLAEMQGMLLSSAKQLSSSLESGGVSAMLKFSDEISESAQTISNQAKLEVGLALSGFGNSVEEVSHKFGAAVSSLSDKLQHLEERIVEATKESSEHAEKVAGAGVAMERAGVFAIEAGKAFVSVSEPIRKSMDTTNDNLRDSMEVVLRMRESVSALESVMMSFGTMTASASALFANQDQRFAGLDSSAGAVIVTLRDEVDKLTIRVGSFFKEYDDHLSRGVGQLDLAVSRLQDLLEEALEPTMRKSLEAIESSCQIESVSSKQPS